MISLLEEDDYYWLNHTTTGICILDLNEKVLTVNDVFKELFGWNSMKVNGQRYTFLPHVPLELRFELNRYVKQIKNNYLSIQYRTIRRRKCGLEIIVDVRLIPLRIKDCTNGLICEYKFDSVYSSQN